MYLGFPILIFVKQSNVYPVLEHTSYLVCLCKNFVSGVNFSRLSEKTHIFDFFRNIFSVFGAFLVVFFGVKFGFRKSYQCKRNYKYEVCVGTLKFELHRGSCRSILNHIHDKDLSGSKELVI